MSRSLDQLRRVSAKLVEGEGETFDSEFLRDGVEFFGITTGRYQCGCRRRRRFTKPVASNSCKVHYVDSEPSLRGRYHLASRLRGRPKTRVSGLGSGAM